jgi:hypothetical protein
MFSIVVKIEGIERRKKSAAVLHLVTGLFLILKSSDYYRYKNSEDFIDVVPFLIIAFISVIYGLGRKRIDPDAQVNLWLRGLQIIAFGILAVMMLRLNRNVDSAFLFAWAVISVMLLFTEKRIFTDTDLLLNEKGVTIPGLYGKHLVPWKSLSNIVIRKDFITIFHKDNKYLQYQVMQTLSDLEIAKMNGFCRDKTEQIVQEEKQ